MPPNASHIPVYCHFSHPWSGPDNTVFVNCGVCHIGCFPDYNRIIMGGAGKFTRALLNHQDWSTCVARIRAVELSQGMRQKFSNSIKDDRVTLADGTFERIGIEDGWADLVVIAQVSASTVTTKVTYCAWWDTSSKAFHWCSDYGKACTEFARILKPSGTLVMVWNVDDRCTSHPCDYLDVYRTEVLQQLHPSSTRGRENQDYKAILDKGEDLVWLDQNRGIFEYPPYITIQAVAQRK